MGNGGNLELNFTGCAVYGLILGVIVAGISILYAAIDLLFGGCG